MKKMLLMKDRSFFYEPRAYLICVKMGEKTLVAKSDLGFKVY